MTLVKPHGFRMATVVGEGFDFLQDQLLSAPMSCHGDVENCRGITPDSGAFPCLDPDHARL